MAKVQNSQQTERGKLADRIRQAREDAHISQKELGESIGVSDKSISSYEKSRSMPPVDKLKKIAKITNKPLLFFTEEKTVTIDIMSRLNTIDKELQLVKDLLTKLQKDKLI